MDPRSHVRRAAIVIAAGALVGFGLQRALQPESFGERGHYRANSLVDLMEREPVHQGRETCASCHGEIDAVHQKDIHWRVQCEDCHGPGDVHVRHHRSNGSEGTPAEAAMPREYTRDGCLLCHRRLAARPADFAQVDPREHYAFLHVTDERTRCIECHSPHEPLFLPESVREARVHPVIYECSDCHVDTPATSHRAVPDHPVIFECGDCHPSVVRDFEKHQHAFMRCTACHLFYRESDTAGRVFRNGNRRFCLLCHERRPFKDPDAVPQIVFVEHVAAMAPVMRLDPRALLDEPDACLQCHFDDIHDSTLMRRLQEQER